MKRQTPNQKLRAAIRLVLEKAEEEYELYYRMRGIRWRVRLTQADYEDLRKLAGPEEALKR